MGSGRTGLIEMIEYIPQTGSTNADLAARLCAGELVPEGHWLIADRQTSGKGRQGREWFDGAGNFMGSTVVHPSYGDPPPSTLALLAGLTLYEVVAALAPQAQLKWPNDLMICKAKLAGILLEREGEAVVVGIGVNLTSAPQLPDRDTIALAAIAPAPDRNMFGADLARQFDLDLSRWRDFGLEPIINRWLAAAHPVGTPLDIGEPGEVPLSGTFAGLSHDGALQLRLADGTERVVHAGEVRFAA
jgi:BirA family transcriptional regulator, biotin operon repressor / biotin---[acetyl-CoA-carboxylase] ligase